MSQLPHKLTELNQADLDKVLTSRFQHQQDVLSRIHRAYKLTDAILVPGGGILEVVLREATTKRKGDLIENMPAIAWDAWIGLGLESFRLIVAGKLVQEYSLDTRP